MLSPDGWLTVLAIRIVESRCRMRQSRILLWPWHFRLREVSWSFKRRNSPIRMSTWEICSSNHRIDRTAIAVGLIHKVKQGMNLLLRHIERTTITYEQEPSQVFRPVETVVIHAGRRFG